VYSRRRFLSALGAGVATVALTRPARAQDEQASTDGSRKTMSGPMSGSAYQPVVRPAKPGAPPSMSIGQRDALEHQIHCQCGCTLDVFTCRTTDFTCPVSPSMHQDVVRLVVGGYTAVEILAAFRETYGERVLMSPTHEGFNWAAYVAPFVALGAAMVGVAALIHRWQDPKATGRDADPALGRTVNIAPPGSPADATPEELARLDAAIRDDSR
jgi:cytochrome c-type biogenesis protein CcmH